MISTELAKIVLPYNQTGIVLDTSSRFEDLGFTPTIMMRMIRQVEGHFGIRFKGEEIVNLQTFGMLVAAVHAKGKHIDNHCPFSQEVGDKTTYQLPVASEYHADIARTVLLGV